MAEHERDRGGAMTKDVLVLRPEDDVAVALRDLVAGERIGSLTVAGPVPRGHKLALRPVPAGTWLRKYGQPIGTASRPIVPGEHVHTHNLEFAEHGGTAAAPASATPAEPTLSGTFDGYRRPGGRAGTRNYLGILTSVNCSATVAKLVAQRFDQEAREAGTDGVLALTHGTGCGLADDGEGLAILRRTLEGYARHPNFAGLVMIGLGCEVNQISALDLPIPTLTIQESGGTAATVAAATAALRELLPEAARSRRTPVPLAELVLGLQCGGSDGYSGLSANPALGVAADLLVAHGGTAVLGETPEIYGAEHLLAARAASPEVAARLLARIDWWRGYVARHGGSLDHNPSPGNRAGGITTILEKSLGAVTKGGSSPLTAVYEYGEAVTERGLVFMDTPGYDPVSATGMVAGGAQLICFTTGRGSVYGCRPVPSVKVATNTELFRRLGDDMDLDCGTVADGLEDVEQAGRRLFGLLVETASGRRTRSEELGFGAEEFVPWQLGAVM
ncbi:altronate dehydratase family protein [Nonomuraea sp. NPDC050310]|uniref:UxaA family hydrolase n=1 Tax=Nonomuraea sp. NPDC050310 TaxID=3154935 RepID=UPI0033DFFE09